MHTAILSVTEDEIFARLRGLPGAFVLADEGTTYFGAFPEGGAETIVPPIELEEPAAGGNFPLWVGALPYEAFRGIERNSEPERRQSPHLEKPVWSRYPAVGRISPGGAVELLAEDESSLLRLFEVFRAPKTSFELPRPALVPIGAGEPRRVHEERIERALEHIARGDLYQVNLARRFRFAVEGTALDLLAGMGPVGRAAFSAALSFGSLEVVSSSPELFLSVEPDGRVETRPIKGTRPRGGNPGDDLRLRLELDESEKERAELAMVIDLERNDLGRIAQTGSVHVTKLPHVISHPTVHHREATVEARLREGVTLTEVVRAMSPSGSVTGAPKVSAMDLIAELESDRRGLYTGSVGYITRSGRLRLSMAIRILTLKRGEAHYFAGGGIVADSIPSVEVLETEWKAEQLRSLIRG